MRSRGVAALAALLALGLTACGSSVLHASDAAAPPSASAARLKAPVRPAFALASAPMAAAAAARLPTPPHVAGAGPLGGYAAPAVLYGVWDPRRGIALRAYGIADRQTRAPARPDMTFRIGSLTKTFTATAVLLLVDDGKVKLDAPVARYVGALVDALPGGRTATVRRLLNMTSGFADYASRGDGPPATVALAPRRIWTTAALVSAAASERPNPSGAFAYSNTNYAILGDLIERVSGMSYATFVKRRILVPLGLRDTRIPEASATPPVQLHGYLNGMWANYSPPPAQPVRDASQPGADVTTWSTSVWGPAADGVSTLGDLARWAADDFGDVLLKPATRAARLRTVPADSILKGSSYGLGLQIEHGWHWHVGEVDGWETLAMANPSTRQAVVVVRSACCSSAFENYLTARRAVPALAPIVDPVYGR